MCKLPGRSVASSLAFCLICFSALAQQNKLYVEERQSNTILMDDGFGYSLIDFGVGRIQVRSRGTKNDFTEPVLWVKLRVTNKSEHLIQMPRYFPSVSYSLPVTDNWGNRYSLRYPYASDVGGNWYGAELPIPGGKREERYKPGESSWAVRLIPVGEFVEGVRELRVYLANQFDKSKFYFKLEDPMLRRRDLLRDQTDPEAQMLPVKAAMEKPVPANK